MKKIFVILILFISLLVYVGKANAGIFGSSEKKNIEDYKRHYYEFEKYKDGIYLLKPWENDPVNSLIRHVRKFCDQNDGNADDFYIYLEDPRNADLIKEIREFYSVRFRMDCGEDSWQCMKLRHNGKKVHDLGNFSSEWGPKYFDDFGPTFNPQDPRPDAKYLLDNWIECKGGKNPFRFRALDNTFETYVADFTFTDEADKMITKGVSPLSKKKVAQSNTTRNTQEVQFALDIAARRANSVKLNGSQELTGIFNGTDAEGCSMVTIEKNWDINNTKRPRLDTFNYRVCNGQVAIATETPLERPPKEIERVIASTARTAQRYGGRNESEFMGYTVTATPLRDRDKCLVEVKILKGINLIERREVNGCN